MDERAGGSTSAAGLALAVTFLAERVGPLPPEVLLRAAPRASVAFSTAPVGIELPPGAQAMTFTMSSPEELEDLLASAGEGARCR